MSDPTPTVIDKLFKERETDQENDAKEHAATVRSLTWIIFALVAVLAILVAGVVGVGVSGHLPGVGDLRIETPIAPAPAPAPAPMQEGPATPDAIDLEDQSRDDQPQDPVQ